MSMISREEIREWRRLYKILYDAMEKISKHNPIRRDAHADYEELKRIAKKALKEVNE